MLVRHKKTFNLGVGLGVSFVVVLILIFSPIFPGGHNGLEFSDNLFNKLSKGSSYFIPKVTESAKKFDGKDIAVTINLDKAGMPEKAVKILLAAGMQVGAQGPEVKISGDFGKFLAASLRDSDNMFKNDGAKLASAYGFDERDAMTVWWTAMNKMVFQLQKAKKIEEANMLNDVMKKAIEPAFNFYQIEAQGVSEKAGTLILLLVFYVLYTMWWGYAIFYMFDGIGLSMKKAKVKKEV